MALEIAEASLRRAGNEVRGLARQELGPVQKGRGCHRAGALVTECGQCSGREVGRGGGGAGRAGSHKASWSWRALRFVIRCDGKLSEGSEWGNSVT